MLGISLPHCFIFYFGQYLDVDFYTYSVHVMCKVFSINVQFVSALITKTYTEFYTCLEHP